MFGVSVGLVRGVLNYASQYRDRNASNSRPQRSHLSDSQAQRLAEQSVRSPLTAANRSKICINHTAVRALVEAPSMAVMRDRRDDDSVRITVRILRASHFHVFSGKRKESGVLRRGGRLAVDGKEDGAVIAKDD
jgi:hypothetical protein